LSDPFAQLGDVIDRASHDGVTDHPYYFFEPFDVEPRSQEILDQMHKDGFDLYSKELFPHLGADPHLFQSGIIYSKTHITFAMAGTQTGKSYACLIRLIASATGELPYSMRYENGVDTGIRRIVSPQNIYRYGRIDVRTKTIIDRDEGKIHDGDRTEWDCGNVVGSGIFPSDLIIPAGEEIRVGTWMRAKLGYWIPKLTDDRKMLVPSQFLDLKKGVRGYDEKHSMIHLSNRTKISMLTYEMDFKKFEAYTVPLTFLDEEPKAEEIFHSASSHTKYLLQSFTPYYGITYTNDMVFPENKIEEVSLYHCCSYDSPYLTPKRVMDIRASLPQAEIGARIWGLPTEIRGKGYFDREKLSVWKRKFSNRPCVRAVFSAQHSYFGMVTRGEISVLPGLVDVGCDLVEVSEKTDFPSWRVYELPKRNTGYYAAVDPTNQSGGLDAESDNMGCRIARLPIEDEEWPVVCATLRARLGAPEAARAIMPAMRFYNNALLAAECPSRGASNAAFYAETKDWPWWYKTVTINKFTGQERVKFGFDTISGSRDEIFLMLREKIAAFKPEDYPFIPDPEIYKELIEAVEKETQGGKYRCDHTKKGSLDMVICEGILLYVWKYAKDQIRCNVTENVRHPRGVQQPKNKYAALGYKESNHAR